MQNNFNIGEDMSLSSTEDLFINSSSSAVRQPEEPKEPEQPAEPEQPPAEPEQPGEAEQPGEQKTTRKSMRAKTIRDFFQAK